MKERRRGGKREKIERKDREKGRGEGGKEWRNKGGMKKGIEGK